MLVGAALALAVTLFLFGSQRMFPPAWRSPSVPRVRFVTTVVGLSIVFGVASAILNPSAAAMFVALVCLGSAPVLALRARRAWAGERAIAGLRAPSTRDASLAALDQLLGSRPPLSGHGYRLWTRLSLDAAVAASRAGMPREAIRWLDRIDDARLDAATVAARGQVLAASCIAIRDRARARRELTRIKRPVPLPVWERALSGLELVLAALDGDPAAVEVRAREALEKETEPILRATLQIARAHALAAMSQRVDATALLRVVATAFPTDELLKGVLRQGGPASPLAESLLSESQAPYR